MKGVGGCLEPGVGCLQVSLVGGVFDSKAVASGGELVSLIEDRPRPFEGLVEGGLLCGDLFVGAFEAVACGVAVEASRLGEFGGGDLTLMSGVVHVLFRCRDRLIVGCTLRCEPFELLVEPCDLLRHVDTGGLVLGDRRAGIDDAAPSGRLEVVEPVRDLTTRHQHRCRRDGGGEFAAGGDRGQIAAVDGQDAFAARRPLRQGRGCR